jgi:hypothetical protein
MGRILYGRVIEANQTTQSGIIQDQDGREYFFNLDECCEGMLPPRFATVTFIRDRDYVYSDVAALIKVDRYPSGILTA